MKQCLVNMSPNFLARLAVASCFLLTGCVTTQHAANGSDEDKLPQQQVADFLSTDCADVWSLFGETTEKNPLYWLRSMDCAERLSPEMARTEARLHTDDSWPDAFRRGILLASAKITPLERREAMSRLDSFSPQIPSQVRPLYQVWRDGQASQLQLSDERSRYSKLQQTSDVELDILRQQQQHLSSQLELTTRKLENLTDIERQLSSRKPASSNFTPDPGHAADPSAATKEAPAAEEKP
ncbi:two-component system QseEF-associated lipoprotein QseG [Scandinavium sp.]|jgi:hypothetical protein|uniref:two-component system QseEF-associated lipoprotein QseG n=1 Tax=Scandinavium sp. TaxID=2830653 RepID=UPI0039C97A79